MALNFAAEPDLILLLDPRFEAPGFPEKVSVKEGDSTKRVPDEKPTKRDSTTHTISDTSAANDASCEKSETMIEMGVSKAHLIESSKYFRKLLNGSFSEASKASSNAVKRITLKDIAIPQFEILMNVVHHRNRKVPDMVDPESLYKLCCLINMYEMHETTLLRTRMWFELVRSQVPMNNSPSLRHWAFICHVLDHPSVFRTVTTLLQWHFKHDVDDYEVPLPPRFDDLLEESCRDAKGRCAKSLRALVGDYENPSSLQCTNRLQECDALTYGSLRLALKRADLDLEVDGSFTVSASELFKRMEGLQVQNYCNLLHDRGISYNRTQVYFGMAATATKCGCNHRLISIRKQLREDMSGMQLKEFP